jgi:hypothetical protein
MVAPVVATFVYQHYGHTMPFYMSGGILALVSILAFRITPVPR